MPRALDAGTVGGPSIRARSAAKALIQPVGRGRVAARPARLARLARLAHGRTATTPTAAETLLLAQNNREKSLQKRAHRGQRNTPYGANLLSVPAWRIVRESRCREYSDSTGSSWLARTTLTARGLLRKGRAGALPDVARGPAPLRVARRPATSCVAWGNCGNRRESAPTAERLDAAWRVAGARRSPCGKRRVRDWPPRDSYRDRSSAGQAGGWALWSRRCPENSSRFLILVLSIVESVCCRNAPRSREVSFGDRFHTM